MSFNDSNTIREGEPPIRPASLRHSREQSPSVVCLIAFGIGMVSAAGVLFAAAVNGIGFTTGKPLFVVGLILALSASLSSLKSAPRWGYAAILVVVLMALLSFVPIYVEHVGDPDN